MSRHLDTPQAHCNIGLTRRVITPPVGIYHRMWGAALHDRSTGVHRPLLATALWLQSRSENPHTCLIVGIDHCLMDPEEFLKIRLAIALAANISIGNVFVSMSHTHGSAWMSRSRAHLPGGEKIGPYLDEMLSIVVATAISASKTAIPGTLITGRGHCNLARHRDFYDEVAQKYVCGFNPTGESDDTVVVIKAVADDGRLLGSLVNYACHPTTLAWENTHISPDYVGAMREVIERDIPGPCLFLQGASGNLGPLEGYVGDMAVADRNGHQLGFAALSALVSLPKPATRFEYAGPVVSGAILGSWKHVPLCDEAKAKLEFCQRMDLTVPLTYRPELPTEAETREQLAHWQAEESKAREANDESRVSECRALSEQMTRQLARLAALPPGETYPFRVSLLRLGQILWVLTPGELYQDFQVILRQRFPNFAVIISTVTNDWQPGYLPIESAYGKGIYQEIIAAMKPGSLEELIESVSREIERLIDS